MGFNVVIATAGHVDHGKSSLIKALTGYDPDRLEEEKLRGLTIDIGFAHIPFGEGAISFVDLPGHEHYIKNMIAGVTGADGAVLCIDVNEGVKPQTIEHTNILKLAGLKEIIVAITKSASKNEDEKKDFEKSVRSFLESYGFGSIDVIFTDIAKPESIEKLRKSITGFAEKFSSDRENYPFMMRVDRVFNKKGFGTVVTGTGIFGKIFVGDTLEIFPGGELARVKNINIHGKNSEFAKAHQRVALNISTASAESPGRGHVLAKPSCYKEFDTFLGEVELFDNHKDIQLKSGKTYHIYIGTSHIDAKIVLLGGKKLENKGKCFCKIKLAKPYPGFPGDIFLMRGGAQVSTIGGGKLISPGLDLNNKNTLEVLDIFQKSLEDAFLKIYEYFSYIRFDSMTQYFSLDTGSILKSMGLLKFGEYFLKHETINGWVTAVKSRLDASERVVLDSVVPVSLLKVDKFYNYLKEKLMESFPKGYVKINSFEIFRERLSEFESEAMEVLEIMEKDISVSNAVVMGNILKIPEKDVVNFLKFLENRELIKKIDGINYITSGRFAKFLEDAKMLAVKDGYIDITNIRDVIDAPRKILIPLLECLDRTSMFFLKDRKRFLKSVKNA